MYVAVSFGKGIKRDVKLHHTIVVVDGKVKEIYKSGIITDPATGKPCYVVFYPETLKVEVHVLEKTPFGWKVVEVREG